MATPFLTTAFRAFSTGILAFVCLGPSPRSAVGQGRPIVIKLATLVPTGSDFHERLKDMGALWEEASGGRVKLTIFSGGSGGEEDDILRRMRLGSLHAGALSLGGLQRITPAVNVLAIPMAMEGREDLARVLAAMRPKLEADFLERGYVILHWADAGWMRFFLPEPDASPEAVRNHKYPQWGEDDTYDLWREAGFPPGVVLNIADIMVGLHTGLIDAINTTPFVVASYQWFPKVPYMLDLPWAPLMGATVVDRRAWERIPADLRPELKRIAEATGDSIQASITRLEAEAIEAMKARGLTVIEPSPEILEEWKTLFESGYDRLKGEMIPEEWFDIALRAARARRGG
jgi:TRAP-type C4-dicarboxylate transport system substrate-binding protein